MKGYGDWLQRSVFQCRSSRKRHAELIALLDRVIHHSADHILIINIGPTESVKPQVVSLGKDFKVVKKQPVIV